MFLTYMLVNDNIEFIHASYILPGVFSVASEMNKDDNVLVFPGLLPLKEFHNVYQQKTNITHVKNVIVYFRCSQRISW